MTRDQVETIIRNYRANLARCSHIDVEISNIQRHLQSPRLADQILAQIQARAVPNENNDGSSRGNRVSRPTERQGIELAEAMERYVAAANAKIQRLTEERERYAALCSFVDAWMKCLSEREQWILMRQVIDSEAWNAVVEEYKAHFGDQNASKNRLKYLKEKGMDRIMSIAMTEEI